MVLTKQKTAVLFIVTAIVAFAMVFATASPSYAKDGPVGKASVSVSKITKTSCYAKWSAKNAKKYDVSCTYHTKSGDYTRVMNKGTKAKSGVLVFGKNKKVKKYTVSVSGRNSKYGGKSGSCTFSNPYYKK